MDSIQRALFEPTLTVRERAYAPYSHFPVGASVMGASGKIYSACNVENASYGLSVCAEINAITQMVANGEREIKALMVIGSGKGLCTPCGICRQTIREFAQVSLPIYLCDVNGDCQIKTLEELLPFSFGPENLV